MSLSSIAAINALSAGFNLGCYVNSQHPANLACFFISAAMAITLLIVEGRKC